jgi:hypothetical protein
MGKGGLGVIDLRLAGVALRTRWLWLQRTEPDKAWASLPMKVEPECDNPPRKIPYYRLNQSTLVLKQ